MCVIFGAFKEERPTDEMLRLGWMKNNAGAGVAWREGGTVRYLKGMTLEEVQAINRHLPFPYVVHLRNPSHGTAVGPLATQPFVVSEDAEYDLKGAANAGVLFHNGFWADWRNKILESAISGGWRLPDGPWTDTRALAIIAHHVGGGALDLVDEKLIWFRHADVKIYGKVGGHNGWAEVNKVLCSNRDWEPVGGSRSMGFIPALPSATPDGQRQENTGDKASTETPGGVSQDRSFRSSNSYGSQSGGENHEKAVQASHERNLRQGMAEQRTNIRLFPGEHMCEDCDTAIARVDEEGKHRCWNCWDEYLRVSGRIISGRAFLDTPGGAVRFSALCQFCWKEQAHHETVDGKKTICGVCFVKQDRPDTRLLDASNPRVRTSVRVQ